MEILGSYKLTGGKPVVVQKVRITEAGRYDAPTGTAYDPVIVDVQGGGGGGGLSKPYGTTGVNFIDYDGSLIAHWDVDEVARKTSLPDNPDHSNDTWGGKPVGLISQGWNWDLGTIQDEIEYRPNFPLFVGQSYATDDNTTRILISVTDSTRNLKLHTSGTADIDWGDGTTSTASDYNGTPHEYANAGDYVIRIESDYEYLSIGGGSVGSGGLLSANVQYPTNSRAGRWDLFQSCIIGVQCSKELSYCNEWAMSNTTNIRFITIPYNPERPTDHYGTPTLFGYIYTHSNVSCVIYPKDMFGFGIVEGGIEDCGAEVISFGDSFGKPVDEWERGEDSMGSDCQNLRYVSYPSDIDFDYSRHYHNICRGSKIEKYEEVSEISNYLDDSFKDAVCLTSYTVPENVTQMAGTFNGCLGLQELRFTSEVPPTVDYDTFANIAIGLNIYVPADSLSDYQSATNYPSRWDANYIGY